MAIDRLSISLVLVKTNSHSGAYIECDDCGHYRADLSTVVAGSLDIAMAMLV